MVDRLAVLLDRFSVSAQVFNAGALCGINTLEADTGLGQLHLIRQGPLEVVYGATSLRIDEPSGIQKRFPLPEPKAKGAVLRYEFSEYKTNRPVASQRFTASDCGL